MLDLKKYLIKENHIKIYKKMCIKCSHTASLPSVGNINSMSNHTWTINQIKYDDREENGNKNNNKNETKTVLEYSYNL